MNFTENIWWIVLGVVICAVLTIFIRWFLGKISKKEKIDNNKSSLVRFVNAVERSILAVCSLDYHLAEVQKRSLKKEVKMLEESCNEQKTELSEAKTRLTNYIESANTLNLFFSFVLAIVAFIAVDTSPNGFTYITYIMFGVVSYRILSRTVEISVSFVMDICDKAKNSSLTNGERIILAIKSLLEEAILFAAMYVFLINGDCNFLKSLIGGLHSFTIDTYKVASELLRCNDLFDLVATWQKICSGVLVTLCIVQYFASNDKNKQP